MCSPECEQARERVRKKEDWAKVKEDPNLKKKRYQRKKAWYDENKDRLNAERRERIANMPTDELAEFLAKERKYVRDYHARKRDEMKANPEMYEAHRAKARKALARHRRRQALSKLSQIGEQLKKLSEDRDE